MARTKQSDRRKQLKLQKYENNSEAEVTEELEEVSPQQHPLLIEVVLQEVSKNLDVSNLKSFRKVCSVWCRSSFQTFKGKCNVKVEFNIIDKSIADFCSTFKTAFENGRAYTSMSIATPGHLANSVFSDWMQTFGNKIIILQLGKKPQLELQKPETEMDKELSTITATILENLLQKWCCQLKFLNIPAPRFKITNPGFYRNDACVELKILKVGSLAVTDAEVNNCVESTAVIICEMVKSVRRVVLIAPSNNNQLSTFASVPSPNTYHLITGLKLENYLVLPSSLSKMSTNFRGLKGLSLGSININEFNPPSSDDLNALLSAVGSHLETLKLGSGKNYSPAEAHRVQFVQPATFLKMTALRTFYLDVGSWDVGSIGVLAKNLINVRTLIVSGSNCRTSLYDRFLTEDRFQAANVNMRELEFWDKDLNPETLSNIVHYYPNMKSFKCDVKAFKDIDVLSGLEKLAKLCISRFIRTGTCTYPKELYKFKALKRLSLEVKQFQRYEIPLNKMVELNCKEIQNSILSAPVLKELKLTRFKFPEAAYQMIKRNPKGVSVELSKCVFETK